MMGKKGDTNKMRIYVCHMIRQEGMWGDWENLIPGVFLW
jgi:hypothetical protein